MALGALLIALHSLPATLRLFFELRDFGMIDMWAVFYARAIAETKKSESSELPFAAKYGAIALQKGRIRTARR